MKIIALVLAITKAIPIIDKWVDRFFGAWTTYQVSKIEGPMLEISKQRKVLMNTISKAQTDEERIILSSLLYKLQSSKL